MFDIHGVSGADGILVAELVGTSVRFAADGIAPAVATRLLRERAGERGGLLDLAAARCAARAEPGHGGRDRYEEAARLLRAARDSLPY